MAWNTQVHYRSHGFCMFNIPGYKGIPSHSSLSIFLNFGNLQNNYGTPELWIYVLEHFSAWMRRPETPGPHMSQHEDSMVIPRFMMQNDLRPLLFLSLAVNCQIDVVFFGRLAETRAGEFSGWRSRSQDIHFVVNCNYVNCHIINS